MDWRMGTTVFHPSASYLLATDTNGLHRFGYGVTEAGRISLTAPSLLHEGARWRALAFTPDGRRLAAFNGESNAALVFDQTLTNLVAAVGPHTEAESIAISANARWLTTGSRSDRAIRVWDLEKQTLVTNIWVGLAPRGSFSKDGRWLAVSGERFELREVATWKLAPPLRLAETKPIFGAAAFSPDNRFLAVVVNWFTVHLFDLQRFESVGVLRPPAPVQLRGLTFSPDGGQLAGYGSEARVALWNLRAMERRLDEVGLGW
jgi:WD40 repeat protein